MRRIGKLNCVFCYILYFFLYKSKLVLIELVILKPFFNFIKSKVRGNMVAFLNLTLFLLKSLNYFARVSSSKYIIFLINTKLLRFKDLNTVFNRVFDRNKSKKSLF